MYTQFRKAVETQGRVRPLIPAPEQLRPVPPGLEEGAIPTAEDLGQTGEHAAYMKSPIDFMSFTTSFINSKCTNIYIL